MVRAVTHLRDGTVTVYIGVPIGNVAASVQAITTGDAEMAEGTIKRLTDKGFGFIDTGKAKDLFFHSSASKASVSTNCMKARRCPSRKAGVRKALVPRTSSRCSLGQDCQHLSQRLAEVVPVPNRGIAECPNRGRIHVEGVSRGRADTPGFYRLLDIRTTGNRVRRTASPSETRNGSSHLR